MVQVLLNAGVNINTRFASGSSALYDAALKGNDEIVCLLVSRGADVNVRESDSGTTPLYAAAAFGREQVVWTLLLWGADPNLRNRDGNTPLSAAESNGFRKVAKQIKAASSRASH